MPDCCVHVKKQVKENNDVEHCQWFHAGVLFGNKWEDWDNCKVCRAIEWSRCCWKTARSLVKWATNCFLCDVQFLLALKRDVLGTAGQSVIISGKGISRDNVCLSRISEEGLVVATRRFQCWREIIFWFSKEKSVCNNGCCSQEKAIGCLWSQFMVTASAMYEAAAIRSALQYQPLLPSQMPNHNCWMAF